MAGRGVGQGSDVIGALSDLWRISVSVAQDVGHAPNVSFVWMGGPHNPHGPQHLDGGGIWWPPGTRDAAVIPGPGRDRVVVTGGRDETTMTEFDYTFTPNCTRGLNVDNSTMICSGQWLTQCNIVCEPGFYVTHSGVRTCELNGSFTGSECRRCSPGRASQGVACVDCLAGMAGDGFVCTACDSGFFFSAS